MSRIMAVGAVWACAAACCASCGAKKSDSGLAGAAALPGPGQMKVVSVEALASAATAPDPANLIKGGDMLSWWQGSPAPKGFIAPDPTASVLNKISAGEGAPNVVEQKWLKPDAGGAFEGLFRAEVPNAPANAEFTLEVGVAGYVRVDVWESAETQAPQLLEENLIVTPPGAMNAKRYVKPFTTRAGGTLVIAARSSNSPVDERGVQWYNWRLTRGGGK